MGRPRSYFNGSLKSQANAQQALFDQRSEQGKAFAWGETNSRCFDQVALQAIDQGQQRWVLLLIEQTIAEKVQLHLQAGLAALVIGCTDRETAQPGEVFE